MSIPLKTVVIVDDEPAVRTLLKVAVAELGYQCIGEASKGQDALELIKRHQPHVVVLDIHMPGMDGLEVASHVIPLGTTAVVIITGTRNPEMARKAMDLGICGYVQKPFDLNQVGAVIESAWHRFQTVQGLQEKTRELEETLEMRKVLEKAKGILMEQQGFSEEEAHKVLQKMSQDQGIALKDVCRSVIQVRAVLGKAARLGAVSRRPAA